MTNTPVTLVSPAGKEWTTTDRSEAVHLRFNKGYKLKPETKQSESKQSDSKPSENKKK